MIVIYRYLLFENLVILILTTFISEIIAAYILYKNINHPLLSTSDKPQWIYRGILLNSVLPLTFFYYLFQSPDYYAIVYSLNLIGSIVSVLSAGILVVSINYHFRYEYSKTRIYILISILSMVLISSITGLQINWDNNTHEWILDRGNLLTELVVYIGGGYLFTELLLSFRLVKKTSKSDFRFLFYSYPIGWIITLLVLVIQETTRLNLPQYSYLYPLFITHALFILVLLISPTFLLLPPRSIKKEIFKKLNIPLNVPIIVLDDNNDIIYFNIKFSHITGYSYKILSKNILNIFKDPTIHDSTNEISSFDDMLNNSSSFIAQISIKNKYGNLLTMNIEMIENKYTNAFKLLILQRVSLIQRLFDETSDLYSQIKKSKTNLENHPVLAVFQSLIHDLNNFLITLKLNVEYAKYENNHGNNFIVLDVLNEIEKSINDANDIIETIWDFSDQLGSINP